MQIIIGATIEIILCVYVSTYIVHGGTYKLDIVDIYDQPHVSRLGLYRGKSLGCRRGIGGGAEWQKMGS